MKVFALIAAVFAQDDQQNVVDQYGSLVYTSPTISTQSFTDGKDTRFVIFSTSFYVRLYYSHLFYRHFLFSLRRKEYDALSGYWRDETMSG